MKGIYFSSPRTLAEAIHPIEDYCADCDWAISLQSGPFREMHFTEEDDPRNVLHLFHSFPEYDPVWFRRGILPTHASDLIFDEWSYYFGFDAKEIAANEMHSILRAGISPGRELFESIEAIPCLYLMHVDDGWWEAYTSIKVIKSQLTIAWRGKPMNSDRWDGPPEKLFPFPETAK